MTHPAPQTILILGGSYAGLHALEILSSAAATLSVILIERNSHFNHIYTFPRNGVISGHAQKAFIPYTSLSNTPKHNSHHIIHASVIKIEQGCVHLDRFIKLPKHQHAIHHAKSHESVHSDLVDSGYGSITTDHHHLNHSRSIEQLNELDTPIQTNKIHWDYLIYALGSHLPPPLTLPKTFDRSKSSGIHFLKLQQDRISKANRILIVGGGPLGIQYATDIADHYKSKKSITLVHSRTTFLPKFKPEMNIKIKQILKELNVQTILGQRVNLIKLQKDLNDGKSIIRVESLNDTNLFWDADLVLLCTGQIPNTSLMSNFCPSAVPIGPSYIKVLKTLQINPSINGPSPVATKFGSTINCDCSKIMNQNNLNDEIWKRVFCIGDCIDGFGSIKAGHTGWNQAEIASKNILKLIHGLTPQDQLDEYTTSVPMIKLTLGLDRVLCQLPSNEDENEIKVFEKRTEGINDNSWKQMWIKMGLQPDSLGDGWA